MKNTATLAIGLLTILAVACFSGCAKKSETAQPHEDHSSHDDGMAAQQEITNSDAAKVYPLKNCVVSGEELGSMGEPVSMTHNGQEVKFCCKDCVGEFKADPEKFLAKLSAGETGESGKHDHDAQQHGEQH